MGWINCPCDWFMLYWIYIFDSLPELLRVPDVFRAMFEFCEVLIKDNDSFANIKFYAELEFNFTWNGLISMFATLAVFTWVLFNFYPISFFSPSVLGSLQMTLFGDS